jgi:hypothetical protein
MQHMSVNLTIKRGPHAHRRRIGRVHTFITLQLFPREHALVTGTRCVDRLEGDPLV